MFCHHIQPDIEATSRTSDGRSMAAIARRGCHHLSYSTGILLKTILLSLHIKSQGVHSKPESDRASTRPDAASTQAEQHARKYQISSLNKRWIKGGSDVFSSSLDHLTLLRCQMAPRRREVNGICARNLSVGQSQGLAPTLFGQGWGS